MSRDTKRWKVTIMTQTTDRMLRRVKDVYFFIQEHGTVTTEHIVEEFNVTPRTAQRDLSILAYNELIESPIRGQWTTNDDVEVVYSS